MTKEQIQEFTLKTTQANHSGLVLVMFEIEAVYVADALAAFNADDRQAYIKNLQLAKRVHNELMNSINPQNAEGIRVLSIFRFIYGRLNESIVKCNPQELDRCSAMMDKLKVGFEKVHESDTEGPVMKNTHQVYAGLTYGKGVLNESYGSMDYSGRGFRA